MRKKEDNLTFPDVAVRCNCWSACLIFFLFRFCFCFSYFWQFFNWSFLHSHIGGCKLWTINCQYTCRRCPGGMYCGILVNLVNVMPCLLFRILSSCSFILIISLPLFLKVLPDDMIVLAEPDPVDMVQAIKKAISILPKIDPQVMHERVSYIGWLALYNNLHCVRWPNIILFSFFIFGQMKGLYNWNDVAKRTEIVYNRALKCSDQSLLERLSRYAIKGFLSEWCSRNVLSQYVTMIVSCFLKFF